MQEIQDLGDSVSDLSEVEFHIALHALCGSDAYPQLHALLLRMRDELGALSRGTGDLIKAYFSGPHGAAAFAAGLVRAGGAAVEADGWDVSELEVSPQVPLRPLGRTASENMAKPCLLMFLKLLASPSPVC